MSVSRSAEPSEASVLGAPEASLNRWALAAGLAVLASTLTAVTVTGNLADGRDGPALKAYHFVLASLGLCILVDRRIPRWRWEALLYFGVVTLTSLVAYFRFPARPLIANVAVAAFALTLGAKLGSHAGYAPMLRAVRAVQFLLGAAIVVKAAIFREAILSFLLAPSGHPVLPTLVGGGVNIEATFMAMGGAFFLGSWLLWPYLAMTVLVSAVYASRVGILAAGALVITAFLRALWAAPAGSARRRRLILTLVVIGSLTAFAGAGVLAVLTTSSAGSYVLTRFASIGEDPGSVGRLMLWSGGVEVFVHHPLGVGLGNAMSMIAHELGRFLPEDNLHNLYLQHFVESGVQGGLAFLLLSGITIRRLFACGAGDVLLVYCGLYFALSLLQFRGAEALPWLVFGLQHGAVLHERATRTAEGVAPVLAPSPLPT